MVNEERLKQRFLKLVSIDAESFAEKEMASYLTEKLETLGLVVEQDSFGNLFAFLAATKGQEEKEAILFSAHMDTVAPGRGKKAVCQADGRITSDGTTVLGADDAAGIAEILEFLQILKEQDLSHPRLEFLLPAAEEPYAQGSQRFSFKKIQAKKAYVLDLDGEIGRAAVAAPSILALKIHIKGRAAHAGFCPEKGVHAIAIAANAIAEIRQGRVGAHTTVNLGTIEGGNGRNIVPESCCITGEVRSLSHEMALEQAEKIRELFLEAAKKEGGNAEVEIVEELRAYRIEEMEPVVETYKRACQHLKIPVNIKDTFGGSDNNHIVKHGIRGIVIANGMHEVHTSKEYTTIQEMVLVTQILLSLL